MDESELFLRIRRIYASIKASTEFDLKKLPAKLIQNNNITGFFQDFSGSLSDEEIHNIAYTVVHNIANFKDHLKQWTNSNGERSEKVNEVFNSSQPLKLIQDLSNNDKHGYPPRKNGYSGLAPQIIGLGSVMQIKTSKSAGSSISMTFSADGTPQISGDGTACVIITGDIVDKKGESVGDLFEIEQSAVSIWESLLLEYDLISTSSKN